MNCPCIFHTEQRGYDWIVFSRLPDRKLGEDQKKEDDDIIPVEEISDDEGFFSAEAEEVILTPGPEDDRTQVEQENPNTSKEAIPDTSKSSKKATKRPMFSSNDLSDGYKTQAKPQMSTSLSESYLHSRYTRNTTSAKTLKKGKRQIKRRKRKKKPSQMKPQWSLKMIPMKKIVYFQVHLVGRLILLTTIHYFTT